MMNKFNVGDVIYTMDPRFEPPKTYYKVAESKQYYKLNRQKPDGTYVVGKKTVSKSKVERLYHLSTFEQERQFETFYDEQIILNDFI